MYFTRSIIYGLSRFIIEYYTVVSFYYVLLFFVFYFNKKKKNYIFYSAFDISFIVPNINIISISIQYDNNMYYDFIPNCIVVLCSASIL